jgi:hypothetical protein
MSDPERLLENAAVTRQYCIIVLFCKSLQDNHEVLLLRSQQNYPVLKKSHQIAFNHQGMLMVPTH